MKPGIPWSVKGIEPEVREAAKHAARRSGMTLGEWLNTVILDQADGSEPDPQPPAAAAKDFMTPAQTMPAPHHRSETTVRLEDIAQQLSRLAQREQESAAIRAYESPAQRAHDDEAMNRILARIDSNERQSVEAFSAVNDRISALGRQLASTPKPVIERPEDVPGYPALEQALRNIVDHIEISERRTRDSLKTMQDRMGDMANRAATANSDDIVRAAPAFNSLETRLNELAHRVQRNEQSPAFSEELRRDIGSLVHRIDGVERRAEQMANTAHANATQAAKRELSEIETRIQTLLQETQSTMSGHAASASEVQRLSSDVATIAQRVEDVRGAAAHSRDVDALRVAVEQLSSRVAQGPDMRPIADMDRRLVDLTQRLEQNQNAARHLPQLGELERRIAELDHRLADVMRVQGDGQALMALEQHLGDVNERLGRTEQQMGHLDTIERAITQLFDGLEQHRTQTAQSLTDLAAHAAQPALPPLADSPEIRALEQGLRAVRESAEQSDRRSQETLEAVHETLEQIVGKLAELETSAAGHQVAATMAQQAVAAAQQAPMAPPQAAPAFTTSWQEPAFPAAPEFAPQAFEPIIPEPAHAAPQPEPAHNPFLAAAPGLPGGDAQSFVLPDLMATAPAAGVPPSVIGSDTIAGDDFIAAARRAAQAAASRAAVTSPAERPPIATGANSRFAFLRMRKATKRPAAAAATQAAEKPIVVPILKAPGTDAVRKKLILAGIVLLAAVSAFGFNMLGRSIVPQQPVPVEAPAQPETKAPGQSSSIAPMSDTAALEAPASGNEITGSLPAAKTDATVASIVAEPGAATANLELPPPELGTDALRQAAAHGDAKAQFVVASRYLDGDGVEQNVVKAAYWYQEAASRGLAPAQYRVATLFERGRGVPKDVATAAVWYERAAANGNVKSMHNAAVIAAGNEVGAPDYDKAFRLFKDAAQHGLKDSQFNLAVLYERGLGTKTDAAEAMFWYLVAARANDADAQKRAGEIAKTLGAVDAAAARTKAETWQPMAEDEAANVVAVTDTAWNAASVSSGGTTTVPQPLMTPPAAAPEPLSLNPVKAVQQMLMKLGFNVGTPDGQMGNRTANAIRLFQLQSGLKVTGEVSSDLIEAMKVQVSKTTGA